MNSLLIAKNMHPGILQRFGAVQEPDIRHKLRLIGEELKISIEVRSWWGSSRSRSPRYHLDCGGPVSGGPPHYRCYKCGATRIVQRKTRAAHSNHLWACPDGRTYARVKWPEIQKDKVILREGRCGATWKGRQHTHHQSLDILDIGRTSFLLRVAVNSSVRHFLIGTDNGHPYVTSVPTTLHTTQDAFDWMVPGFVRNALTLSRDVRRQGDWFFVHYNREPKSVSGRYGDSIPQMRPARRRGVIYRNVALLNTRHTADFLIYVTIPGITGVAAVVKGTVKAPDHAPLTLDGWHVAVRRRALPAPRYSRDSILDD